MEKDILQLKEKGNELYKDENYISAISCYMKAASNCLPDDSQNLSILYNNIALCDMKLNRFEKAIKMTTKSLNLNPGDYKALYRRCMAYENSGKIAEAFKDAKLLFDMDQKFILPTLIRLKESIQEKSHSSSSGKILDELIHKLIILTTSDADKKKALEHLVSITHEKYGAEMLYNNSQNKAILDYVLNKNEKFILLSLKIIQNICANDEIKALHYLNVLGLNFLIKDLMIKVDNETCGAITGLLLTLISALTGINVKEGQRGDPAKCQEHEETIKTFFTLLLEVLANRAARTYTIDQTLNLIIKLVDREKGLDWCFKIVTDLNALPVLLDLASRIEDFHDVQQVEGKNGPKTGFGSGSCSTFALVSLALYVLSEDMVIDSQRNTFRLTTTKFVEDLLDKRTSENNIKAVRIVTCLLQGPFSVGDSLVGTLGIVNLMLIMAGSTNEEEQIVALEAIILTASSRKRCQGVMLHGVSILKKLYQTGTDKVKIRALVGICKLSSSGGIDSSLVPFEESSNLKLAEACKKFLEDSSSLEMKKWAAEGLAYLSFNADIKEFVIEDDKLITALFSLSKNEELGESIIFPLASMFVNLTNSYEKPKIEPELLELAKQAKQHIPVDSPKDAEEYVDKRLDKLITLGIVSAMVPLCKTQSLANRELLSRIFFACARDVKNRGLVIQQGGARALLNLALNNTDEGKIIATQALARINITNHPEIVFGGEKYLDLVRPLLQLLNVERTGLQNYEALMALTNIASIGETARRRILLEKGMTDILYYLYDDHPLLRRGSAECLCNLMLSPEFVDKFVQVSDDRVKMLGLVIIDTDDYKLQLAAAGALCSLLNNDDAISRILEIKSLMEILKLMLMNDNVDLQYRGIYIARSLVYASQEFAEKLIDSDLYYALIGMSELMNVGDPDNLELKASGNIKPEEGPINPLRLQIRNLANETFEKAKDYGIVKRKETESVK